MLAISTLNGQAMLLRQQGWAGEFAQTASRAVELAAEGTLGARARFHVAHALVFLGDSHQLQAQWRAARRAYRDAAERFGEDPAVEVHQVATQAAQVADTMSHHHFLGLLFVTDPFVDLPHWLGGGRLWG